MALEIFMNHYLEHMLDTTELYCGIRDVLDFFSDKTKIIVTNKHYNLTRKMTDYFDITDAFEEIVGVDSTPYRKPEQYLLKSLMNRYNIESSRTVVIGDGINDIIFAKNACAISCAFLNGLGIRKELLSLRPDFSYEEPLELKAIFY
jgi:phosphoglycolate phosphatase